MVLVFLSFRVQGFRVQGVECRRRKHIIMKQVINTYIAISKNQHNEHVCAGAGQAACCCLSAIASAMARVFSEYIAKYSSAMLSGMYVQAPEEMKLSNR